jgi:hypothetical protein
MNEAKVFAVLNYTVTNLTAEEIFLHRKFINSSLSYDLIIRPSQNARFDVAPSNNGTYSPPTINIIQVDPSQPAHISVQALTNITSLEGLRPSSIFLEDHPGLNNGSELSAQEFSFLGYTSKFLAGSWRFLTYFGRDTMLSAHLTLPILKPTAVESVMAAVLDRINSTGALCHEETIGDYASFINIQYNQTQLGDQPFLDYKMVDTDLELLPLLNAFYEHLGQNVSAINSFLDGNSSFANDTYRNLLQRNVDYNMNRAAPFASSQVYSNLISLRAGQPVGNWRDSNQGLGYGQYPFDVNSRLLLAF